MFNYPLDSKHIYRYNTDILESQWTHIQTCTFPWARMIQKYPILLERPFRDSGCCWCCNSKTLWAGLKTPERDIKRRGLPSREFHHLADFILLFTSQCSRVDLSETWVILDLKWVKDRKPMKTHWDVPGFLDFFHHRIPPFLAPPGGSQRFHRRLGVATQSWGDLGPRSKQTAPKSRGNFWWQKVGPSILHSGIN